MSANEKRCWKCKTYKPIREFTLGRHRLCTACRLRSVMPAVELAALRALGTPPPQRALPTTTDYRSYQNYQVEYKRQAALDREALARAAGKPVKTPKYRSVHRCVRCGFKKHVSQFDNPRDRICLACYDPRPLP